MNLEDLKNQWAAFDKKLELNLRLNAQLLRDSSLRKTNSALQRLSRSVFIELLISPVAVIPLGLFMANHFRELPFLVPALTLHLFVLFHIAFGVYQLVELRRIDFSAPIIVSQKKLGTLRLQRIRASMWTLLLAPLLWVPLLIVTLKGVLGVNAYATFDAGWLIANLLLGVAVIPLMLWVSKRYADRLQNSPMIQQLMNDIAGRSLSEATAFLDELARFEQETEQA